MSKTASEHFVGAMLVSGHAQQETTTIGCVVELTAGGRYFARFSSPGVRLPQLSEVDLDYLIDLATKAKAELGKLNQ